MIGAAAATAAVMDGWTAIHSPDCPLHLGPRDPTLSAGSLEAMLARIERTDSNACRKVDADYTAVRLINTYACPGTDVAPHADEEDCSECCLERVPTGWIGLFKGKTYHPDHPPCFHRSPPAGNMGDKRLVLIIDTPAGPPSLVPK